MGTQAHRTNAFSALLAGDTAELDVAWLERHGLAAYALAAGARHPRLRALVATQIVREQSPAEALRALRGLDVIGFKGIDYARRLYPTPELRPMGDHDLLVRERDFVEAVTRLRAIGYVDALVQHGVAAHPGHYAAQLMRGAHQLDVHRSIRQTPRASVPYDEVFSRAQPDGDIAWLEPVDRLLMHCMHMAGHECVVPLIQYLDLELLLLQTPIDRVVVQRARQWRVCRSLQAVLTCRARLRGWAGARASWLPSARELHEARRPGRALQLARKALLMEGRRELFAFAWYAISSRRPYRS